MKPFPRSLQAELASSDACFPQFWGKVVCDDLVTVSHGMLSVSACPPPRRPSSLEASRVVRYT